MDTKGIIRQLMSQRAQIDKAIETLNALDGNGAAPRRKGKATSFDPAELTAKPARKRRKMSKAGRAKIAAAQRARWAKVKGKK